jgi:hypothetical protein
MLLEDYAPGRKFTSLESFEMTPKGLPIPAANAFIADNLSANGMKMVRGELDQALASGRPFIAFVDGGGEGLGHAVVVQEARTVAGVKSVVVRDPMVGAYLQPITDFDGSLIGHLEGMSYPCVWGKKK